MLLAEQCESGDDAACAVLDKEEAAWLAKMGAGPWGAATSAHASPAGVLTKLDATRWGLVRVRGPDPNPNPNPNPKRHSAEGSHLNS